MCAGESAIGQFRVCESCRSPWKGLGVEGGSACLECAVVEGVPVRELHL